MPVNVTGVKQLQKALRTFDAELLKAMNYDIKGTMLPIRDKARSYLPLQNDEALLSGWAKPTASGATAKYRAFPSYDYATAKAGITYKAGSNKRNRGGWSVTNYVSNESAPGAIYETAGRKNKYGTKNVASLNPNASIQFIESLPPLVDARVVGAIGRPSRKQTGRLIYRAWAEDSGKVYAKVLQAIENTCNAFNSKQKAEMVATARALRSRPNG
jgi:hypothetical protein